MIRRLWCLLTARPFRVWRITFLVAASIAIVSTAIVWPVIRAATSRATRAESFVANALAAAEHEPAPDVEARIAAFCGDCHALPLPEGFPRDAWNEEVNKGYEQYARSGRSDLKPPPIYETVAYYRGKAPKELILTEPTPSERPLSVKFRRVEASLGLSGEGGPAISHLQWIRLAGDTAPQLFACDMRSGAIGRLPLPSLPTKSEVVGRLVNPCRLSSCDFDGDGAPDLLAADLGSFFPGDHDRGRVVWLERQPSSPALTPHEVAAGLGRVADVRPADVDRDGDLDLIVAEFGHYLTGGIWLWRNVSDGAKPMTFSQERIDSRPGAIHVPAVDFDHDGDIDFLAVFSQEHECLTAFINQGSGRFNVLNIWSAPDLTYGSNGIDLVDLDRDGDLDVLYSNGDAFDNSYVNPAHGVQWFENVGDWRFKYHRIGTMFGVCRALAGDIDRDGDLDVVCASWLPPQLRPGNLNVQRWCSVACFEQTTAGAFERHVLEEGQPCHAAMELADFDRDGDLDIAVGMFAISQRNPMLRHISHELTIWWNESRSKP